MVSAHHLFDSFSILGIVLGVAALPIAILGTLFLVVKAVTGL
jgi:hypothetical protein